MKTTKLYFYCAFSYMYGTLHGMYDGNIEETTYDEATLEATECSRNVIESFHNILEDIYSSVNEMLGYEDTPDNPDEEYLDEVESIIQEEIAYVLYEVTRVGRNHTEEMLADVSDYEYYREQGWLVPCEEDRQFSL